MEVENAEQLAGILQKCLEGGEGRVVIQAGHYPLDILGNEAIDRLDATATSSLARNFANFAGLSWSVACALTRMLSATTQSVQVMTLVNDWQFLRAGAGGRRAQVREASLARGRYYSRVPTLPAMHLAILAAQGLGDESVFKWSQERWLFSEDSLRTGLAATLKRLKAEGRARDLGIVEETTPEGEPIVRVQCSLDHEVCLLYCGNTNCAGEVVELLRVLHERGVRRFVNVFPRECMIPVEAGTVTAHDIFTFDGMLVVNAGLTVVEGRADTDLSGVVSIHEF